MRTIMAALALLALAVSSLAVLGQDSGAAVYTDPQGRFTVPVPDGWTDTSDEAGAHFSSPNGAANLYVRAVDGADLAAGMTAVLESLFPGWDAESAQTVQAPLPNGTWVQDVYIQEDGLVIALGQAAGDSVIVMVAQGQQAALQAVNPTTLATLGGIVLLQAQLDLPDYINPDAFTEREVTVGAEGWPLPGTLTVPVGDGPFPAVVLVHGSGPGDRDQSLGPNRMFRDLAQGLASQGIAVLRYDKRTRALAEQVMADPEFTIDSEYVDDALAGAAFLRTLEEIDPAQVFVLAHSQGVSVAPRIAAADPDIAGLILLAGLARPFEASLNAQLEYQLALAEEHGEEITPQAQAVLAGLQQIAANLEAVRAGADPLETFGDPASAAYWASVVAADPLAEVAGISVPILVLQGERDYQATMEDFALWQEALAGRDNVTFISYPALNHLFMETGEVGTLALPSEYSTVRAFVDAQVIDDIAAWILGTS